MLILQVGGEGGVVGQDAAILPQLDVFLAPLLRPAGAALEEEALLDGDGAAGAIGEQTGGGSAGIGRRRRRVGGGGDDAGASEGGEETSAAFLAACGEEGAGGRARNNL